MFGGGGGGEAKRICRLNIEALHVAFAFLLPYIIGHICIYYLQKCNDGRKTFILLLATYILLEDLSVLLLGVESDSNLCQ